MKPLNLEEITRQWLKANGFDGLSHPDGECGCAIGSLMPCGQPLPECTPGYAGPCNELCEYDGECDFHIYGRKVEAAP